MSTPFKPLHVLMRHGPRLHPAGRLPNPLPGIERVPKAIAKEVAAKHDQGDRDSRIHHQLRCVQEEQATIAEHRAPFGGRRLGAQPQETESGNRLASSCLADVAEREWS